MSDDLERQLRERLHRAALPGAPLSLRVSLETIVQTPPDRIARRDRRPVVSFLAVAALVSIGGVVLLVGGGGPDPDTALDASALTSPSPSVSPSATLDPSATPSPSASGSESATPASPTPKPTAVAIDPLVRGSAREVGERVLMAPGPDGTLYVTVPDRGGAVLALLDSAGQPLPGWPITVKDTSSCDQLLPVADGSVRLLCDATDQPPPELGAADVRAFAFGPNGRPLEGWPLQLECCYESGRMVGDTLTLVKITQYGDVEIEGVPNHGVGIVTVGPDGRLSSGVQIPMIVGALWAVGPDRVAYGTARSEILAVGPEGIPRDWLTVFSDVVVSRPAFDAAGRVHLTLAPEGGGTARAYVMEADGRPVVGGAIPPGLPLGIRASGECDGIEGTCITPASPLVGSDGTTVVVGAHFDDTEAVAVSPAGKIMAGWPYRSTGGSQDTCFSADRMDGPCDTVNLAAPAIGPDNTIFIINAAASTSMGGSIVAVGPDGAVRFGWPVGLARPGSAFWSVVVGSDGTAYALAIEPEAGDTTSATILAIAPDSSVRWTNTIIEP